MQQKKIELTRIGGLTGRNAGCCNKDKQAKGWLST